eukprot:Platyproteum_vivax@DN7276_c0_g1_i5.p1
MLETATQITSCENEKKIEVMPDAQNVNDAACDVSKQSDVLTPPACEENVSAPNISQQEPKNSATASATAVPTAGPWPQREIKLFIGRVPKTHEEDALRPMFEEYGTVLETTVIRDRTTQEHKGCAFVKMACLAEADAAIRELHNTKILDKAAGAMQIKYAQGECERLGLPVDSGIPGSNFVKLFVGSLPRTITDAELRSVFEPYGMIEEVYIMKDEHRTPKGCAFVKMNKEGAFHAIENLNGLYNFPKKKTEQGSTDSVGSTTTRPMEVRFAENKKQQAHPFFQQNSMQQQRVGSFSFPRTFNIQPPPPNPWIEYRTQDGRAYYHNTITNMTQWELPLDFDITHQMRMNSRSGSQLQTMPNNGSATGPPGANLFIFHVPNEWTDNDLYNHFAQFGNIVGARIATCKSTGRNRGFAFVSFDNVPAALQAVQHMNGFQVVLPGAPAGTTAKRLKVLIKRGEEDMTFQNNAAPAFAQRHSQPSVPFIPQQMQQMPFAQQGYPQFPFPTPQQKMNFLNQGSGQSKEEDYMNPVGQGAFVPAQWINPAAAQSAAATTAPPADWTA